MNRDNMLLNWNNIDIIEDKNSKKYAINKTEAYENKEQFLNDCIENNLIDANRSVEDVRIGGITCCCKMQKWEYGMVKKHGKTDMKAYYIEMK